LIERTAKAMNDSDHLTCWFSRISRAVLHSIRPSVSFSYTDGH